MRNLIACFSVITFALLVSARADLTIVQRVEGPGQTGDTTVKIKGDKERIDGAGQPTRILDGKSGEMIDLMTDKKTFVKISAEQIKAAAEAINKFGGDQKAKAKLTPTGKKETINGYETEELVYDAPQFKVSFWVAKKYPDSSAILKEMQGPVSGAWKPSNMGMPDYTDFEGLPLKTVISMGENQVTTIITSIKKDSLNATEFEIPKDFHELTRPAQSGLQPGGNPGSAASPAATP